MASQEAIRIFQCQVALLNNPCPYSFKTRSDAITNWIIGSTNPMPEKDSNKCWEALLKLTPEQALERKREWNRDPLADLFPRIPSLELDRVLELLIAKDFVYDLSQSRLWNARRYSSLTVACVRHWFSDYDKLLREGLERFEARARTGDQVWKVLREWCPWDSSNEVLRRCFEATLLRPEQRGAEFVDDPMDIDDFGSDAGGLSLMGREQSGNDGYEDDPMDID